MRICYLVSKLCCITTSLNQKPHVSNHDIVDNDMWKTSTSNFSPVLFTWPANHACSAKMHIDTFACACGYFDIWCKRETLLSLINYRLWTHIWEVWTARSVNNNVEVLHGFAPQANDSPGCNIPQLSHWLTQTYMCAHTHTHTHLINKHWDLNKEPLCEPWPYVNYLYVSLCFFFFFSILQKCDHFPLQAVTVHNSPIQAENWLVYTA